MTPDPTGEVLDVLREFFSAPIARALVTATARRAFGQTALDASRLPVLVTALERTLPTYISDPARRATCMGQLRKLLPQTDDAQAAHGPSKTRVYVRNADDAANAADVARDLARSIGFSEIDQIKIATVTAELARNILHYARTGEVTIALVSGTRPGVEIMARDQGPGIEDLAKVMSENYKSKTGMGMGLKGSKRLMDHFDLRSKVGEGTTVIVRKLA